MGSGHRNVVSSGTVEVKDRPILHTLSVTIATILLVFSLFQLHHSDEGSISSARSSPSGVDRPLTGRGDTVLAIDEGYVSGLLFGSSKPKPAGELKKTSNSLNRWLERLTKDETAYEIPNYPLDEQPDPERVTHIDADLRYCTDGIIRDQRECGACYAFSWNSLAEWHYCAQTKGEKRLDLSEQHIVDCGYTAHLKGCVEGKLSDVRDFSQVYGFHLEQDYPYTGKQGACKKGSKMEALKVAVKVNDFKRVRVERENFEHILEEQPILLEVHLPDDIQQYASGIHPGDNCDPQYGHGMLLVGHGRQEGKPYWLLRNSMGRKWGENGYLRLSRDMADMGRCFKTAFVAKFKFKELDEDKYVDFYDSLAYEPELALPVSRPSG